MTATQRVAKVQHMNDAIDPKSIGAVVREQRERLGMQLQQLAADAGVTPGAMSQLEKGSVNWTVARLCKVATALGMTPDAVLRMARMMTREPAAA